MKLNPLQVKTKKSHTAMCGSFCTSCFFVIGGRRPLIAITVKKKSENQAALTNLKKVFDKQKKKAFEQISTIKNN